MVGLDGFGLSWNTVTKEIVLRTPVRCFQFTTNEARELAKDLSFAANCVDIAIDAQRDLPPTKVRELEAEVAATMDAAGIGVKAVVPIIAGEKVAGPADDFISKIHAHPNQSHLVIVQGQCFNLGDAKRIHQALGSVIEAQTSVQFRVVSCDPHEVDRLANLAATVGDQ